MFERNTVVWAKLCGYPWWPSYIEEKLSNNLYKVQFIGEHSHQHLNPDKIKSWAENFEEYSKVLKRNKRNEKFFAAVELGINIHANVINFDDQYLFISNCMKKISRFTEEDVRQFCLSINNVKKKVSNNNSNKSIKKKLSIKYDNKKGVFHKKVEPIQHKGNNVQSNIQNKLKGSLINTSNSLNKNNNIQCNNGNMIQLNDDINQRRLSRSVNGKEEGNIIKKSLLQQHEDIVNKTKYEKGQTYIESFLNNQQGNEFRPQRICHNKLIDFSKEIEELISCQTSVQEDLEFIFSKIEKYNVISHIPFDITKLDFNKKEKNDSITLKKQELINYLIFLCNVIQIPTEINNYLSSLITEFKSFQHN